MARIHPYAYVTIGAVVAVTSLLVRGLLLFVFVGTAMVFWGVATRLLERPQRKNIVLHCARCRRPLHNGFCAYCGLEHSRGHPHFHKGGHYQNQHAYEHKVRRVQ